MSRVLDFYRGGNEPGFTAKQALSWNDDTLERRHDWVQWVFPIPTVSMFNPDAPILSADDAAAFRADASLQTSLRLAAARFTKFLHLADDPPPFVTPGNHNFLRCTRVLQCLRLCGLHEEAAGLFAALDDVYGRYPGIVGARTYRFWTDASKA